MAAAARTARIERSLTGQVIQVSQTALMVLVCCVAASLGPLFGSGQGTSVISGVVSDAATSRPVPDTTVTLTPIRGTGGPLQHVTDQSGQFSFRGVTNQSYRLTAAAPGFLQGGMGQAHPLDSVELLTVSSGAPRTDLQVRLWRAATIHGRVTAKGNPLAGIRVTAYREEDSAALPARATVSATTDDHGDYALTELVPGRYRVGVPFTAQTLPVASGRATSANNLRVGQAALRLLPGPQAGSPVAGVENDQLFVYRSAYWGGATTAAAATPVVVAAGAEHTGIDLMVNAVPAAEVSGKLVSLGEPAGNVEMQLIGIEPSDPALVARDQVAHTRPMSDGQFTFLGVPAGNYRLQAAWVDQSSRSTPVRWGRADIQVGTASLSGVSVALQDGLSVHGKLVLELSGRSIPLAGLQVQLQPLGRGGAGNPITSAAAHLTESGTFALRNLLPGQYAFRLLGAPGVDLGWIESGGVRQPFAPIQVESDLGPINLVATNRLGSVAGAFAASLTAAASVLMFPVDPQRWSTACYGGLDARRVPVVNGRRFSVQAVPPGEYFVVGLRSEEISSQWCSRASLAQMSAIAIKVSVTAAQRVDVALKLPGR